MSAKTTRLKAEAVAWLRYGKKLPIVCTEVGTWSADVLGVGKTASVEVETKVSRADLRAEFRNKTTKHKLYQDAGQIRSIPNYMYFLVPEELKDAALEIVGEGNPKAGVAFMPAEANERLGQNIVIVKKAAKLHDRSPSKGLIRVAMLRMSSELCGLWATNERLHDWVSQSLESANRSMVRAAYRAAGALDVEDPGAALELRAAELALAVEGVDWAAATEDLKQRWREAGKRYLDIAEPAIGEWEDATESL